MSSVSGQGPLSPNDPEYYAPARVRERRSLPQGPGLDPISPPMSLPAALDTQPNKAPPDALRRRPIYPEIVGEPAGFTRELDWRGELFGLAARFALAAGVVTVVALLFFILLPASHQSDTASTSPETTGSTKAAPPPSGQVDLASKPALSQFRALLATAPVAAPVGQPATHDESQQLLQGFMQWRQKENPGGTSR
jgi:hypothetical protein